MKKHLLSILFLARAVLTGSRALAWDAPVAPQRPAFDGAWVTPATGSQYYIYHVGSGQFMGTGLDWGTRTCTTVDSVVLVSQTRVAVALNRNYVVPFSIEESDIDGLLYIRTLNTNKGESAYVTAEGNASWSDGDTSRAGHWVISPTEDDAYTLDVADSEVCLGLDGIGITTSYTWADAVKGDRYTVAWRFLAATDETAEAIKGYTKGAYAAYLAATDLYAVRQSLYEVLTEADELGIDNSAAGAIYTQADATLEQLQAALDELKAVVDADAFRRGIAGASPENPFDVTKYVMQNADFSAACENGKTPAGWEITVTGTNIGQQNRKDTNPDDETLYLDNFVECWTPAPATLGDGYIGQWVTGLPQGRYRLTMEAVACNQSDGFDPTTVTGVYLFAGNGNFNLHGEESVAGAPYDIRHYEWDFDFNAERLLLGLLFEGTNASWVSADNFHLYAIGAMQDDPAIVALRAVLDEAWEFQDQLGSNMIDDDYSLSAGTAEVEALQQAIEQSERAVQNADTEQANAALAALQTALADVRRSVEVYQSYRTVYAEALFTAQRLKDLGQWDDLQAEILNWAGYELADAFEAGTLTEAGLKDAQQRVADMMAAYVGVEGHVQPGNDLTVLIRNADFSRGQYGRTDATTFDGDENAVPGWNIASGNITELSGDYHNVEVYGKAFDVNQTLRNLPAGTYRLTVQGYVRVDSGENDMVLYAGVSSKRFMEITDEYSTTALLGDVDGGGSTGSWPYDTPRPDGLGYQPNSMQGASVYFEAENPATGRPFYLNDVTIGHTGGDLTIGVKSDHQNNSLWILWDNFTLTFVSSEAIEPILEEIDELRQQMDELLATNNTTLQTREQMDPLYNRIEQKNQLATTDEALALLDAIKEMMAQIKDDEAHYQEIISVSDAFSLRVYEVSDENFINLLDEVTAKISNMDFENVEEIAAYILRLKEGWVTAVMSGATEGSDVTLLIANPDFETQNADGWSIIPVAEGGRIGDNQGYQANAVYNNEEAGLHVEHFVEAWRADSQPLYDGDICQDIGVLPQGYYQLTADGFATNQAGEPDGGIKGIFLCAQVGDGAAVTPFAKEVDWIPQHYTVNFFADGKSEITIGIRISQTNSNWFLADNFGLIYLGQTPPDAIVGTEATATLRPAAIYSVHGIQTRQLQRGLNIVRGADGQVRKVMVR